MKWIVIPFFLCLCGCAASDVARQTASDIDNTYIGVSTAKGELSVDQAYQNSSQTTKGVFYGGVAGGVVGSLYNGVGVVPGTVTGAILGGALGAYIDAHTNIVDKLRNRGVKLIVIGDQVLIVLPSYRTFVEYTPQIRYSAYSTLDMVSQLIGNFVNMSVKVTAYTDFAGPARINSAVSQEQAENVAKYLWRSCINTRLIYAVGCGNSHVVEPVSCGWTSENNRVEITLEKLPT